MGSTILLLSFLGVAVFGFVAMGHQQWIAHRECLVDIAVVAGCPAQDDLSIFHARTFQSFSIAVFAAFAAFIVLVVTAAFAESSLQAGTQTYITKLQNVLPRFRESLIGWLKIFEKRDPAAVFLRTA